MENSGIVRRIDDLGRIVIPREYRKLHGIELGDPVEISAMGSGEIVIKKVDVKNELIKNAKKIIGSAEREIEGTLLLTDGERWLWGKGERKNEFVDNAVTKWVKTATAQRESYVGSGDDGEKVGLSEPTFVMFYPAIAGGDCFGALCLVSDTPFSAVVAPLISVLAKILGEYMNKY